MDWSNNIPKSIQGEGKPLEIGTEAGWDLSQYPHPSQFNYTSSSVAWREWLISQGYDAPEMKVSWNLNP